ncbi:MAG: glycosyltransferase family 4 protein [Rhodospirillaceae bacterium]
MKILVHDYSGHPFQVQLSRELARRGHDVLHIHASFFQTPKGALLVTPDDPPGLAIEPLDIGEPFAKHRFVRRIRQEIRYGRLSADRMRAFGPDVVLSSNVPLDPQNIFQRACRDAGAGFAFWLQDIYSVAIDRILRRRFPGLGHLVGARYTALERRLLRDSDAVVAITEDFLPTLARWGVTSAKCHVVENWAPIEELPEMPRDTAWRREHGLAGRQVILYSGTLGMKHNPALLLELALKFRDRPDVAVAVVSEGPGADWLARHGHEQGLANLRILPFQPFSRFPEVLASGDLLVAILEPDAGIFSVPSKILSYLCAARPILAAMPVENLAARIVVRNEIGRVVGPGDLAGFVDGARALLDDADLARTCGTNARRYAETRFRIADIGARFDRILSAIKKD